MMTPETTQLLGAAATLYGVGGALSVLLQARRMHLRGTSGDVSVRFFAVYVGGFAVWLLYGIGIGDLPVIVVHAVGLVCGTITLTVALRLRGQGDTPEGARSAGEKRTLTGTRGPADVVVGPAEWMGSWARARPNFLEPPQDEIRMAPPIGQVCKT